MTHQLETWEGEFGTAYTDRNVVDWHVRLPAFRHMLEGLRIGSVLEVGCNRGHNLLALANLLPDAEVVGLEPNRHALQIARASGTGIAVLSGHALDIPFRDATFDLVLTAGVLIHIPLDSLAAAMGEIRRVTRRYVLAVEYYAEEETLIPYRGHEDLLWKRDFLKHYQSNCPDLTLLRCGQWGAEAGFDRTRWWLLQKSAGSEAGC
ncbi:MAG TPA: methyltransferase domain-containing protein [Anaerolineae bacterium]|nr:methyltransferase domain-containing protein [Anaerolineae bacterium]